MRLRKRHAERRASAMVELAFVLPLFLFFVLGIIEASRMGMAEQLLVTAAREGCRVAVIPGAALVEASVVLFFIFLPMVLGAIEMTRAGMAEQMLTSAAREGCRVAVTPGSDATAVQNRVNAYLQSAGITTASPPVTTTITTN